MNLNDGSASDGWTKNAAGLTCTFEFSSFMEGIAFVNRVASLAEAQQHHPDIHIVYNHITVTTLTHDAGDRITDKDLVLANAIQAAYKSNTD